MAIAIPINLPVKQKRWSVAKEGQVINEGKIEAKDFVVLNGDEVINKGKLTLQTMAKYIYPQARISHLPYQIAL